MLLLVLLALLLLLSLHFFAGCSGQLLKCVSLMILQSIFRALPLMRPLCADKKHHNLLPMSTFIANFVGILIPFQRHKSTLVGFGPHHLFAYKHPGVFTGGDLT